MLTVAGLSVLVVASGGAERRFTPEEVAVFDELEPASKVRACRGIRQPYNLCIFGDAKSREASKWLLWGDSHAESILPAINEVAKNKKKSLVYASEPACAPLPGVIRIDRTFSASAACERFLEEIEAHVIDSGSYDTVVLHARWSLYANDSRDGFDDQTSITLVKQNGADSSKTNLDANLLLFDAALTGLMSRLGSAGIRVVLIGSVPEMPYNVIEKLKAKILYDLPLPSEPNLEEVEARQGLSEDALAKIAVSTGAVFVPLIPELCNDTCLGHDGLTAFYRDRHHLTPGGALKLIKPILEDIQL